MKIGIVGAGTMGVGIAQVFARSEGYEILLSSSRVESAERGIARMEKQLARRLKKENAAAGELEKIMSKVRVCAREELSDCELVIEAITENMAEKKALFAQLTKLCSDTCIFATNTSSLSIREMSAGIRQPFIGTHFFNPAPGMKLVEVITTADTPEETVDRIMELLRDIGKTPVRVRDSAGFVVNRMLIPMINEAIGMYDEGVASAESIDTAMKLGANHPMGPLALGDLIGLDVCLAILEVLQKEMGNAKYAPHPLLRKMVREGQLGVKTGKGIYTYQK